MAKSDGGGQGVLETVLPSDQYLEDVDVGRHLIAIIPSCRGALV